MELLRRVFGQDMQLALAFRDIADELGGVDRVAVGELIGPLGRGQHIAQARSRAKRRG